MKRLACSQAEEEMRRKIDLIQQIRALESVPIVRHKFVDPTETSGHGLLAEMSIAELHERLALAKLAYQEEEETRRKEIAANKEVRVMYMTTLNQSSCQESHKTKVTFY
jgi:hypothetical protein